MNAEKDQVFRVLPRQVGQSVAAALGQWLPGRPRAEVRRLLKSRRVMLNGNLCTDADRRLRLRDVVKLLAQSAASPIGPRDIRICYLDKHVAVVEKPAGITSVREEAEHGPRNRRQFQPTLDELMPRVIAQAEGRRADHRLPPVLPVHRLDRDTSGLMVFARTRDAEKNLSNQFRRHTIQRRYVALVHGAVKKQTIESRLVRDRGDGLRGSTTLPNVGKPAVTHVRPIERLGDYTLIECRLETGRTHQIRIHLSEAGHPLCGDRMYLQPLFKPRVIDRSGAARLALAAVELGFTHPTSGEPLKFSTPLPPDLAALVARLREKVKGARNRC